MLSKTDHLKDKPRFGVSLLIKDAHPQPVLFRRRDDARRFQRLLEEMFEPPDGIEVRSTALEVPGANAYLRFED
jgi:hypothetical protein